MYDRNNSRHTGRTDNYDRRDSGASRKPRFEPQITGEAENASVKWFNLEKKYGFVVSEDKGDEVFLHVSALEYSGVDPALLDRGTKIRIWRGLGRNQKESVVKVEIPNE